MMKNKETLLYLNNQMWKVFIVDSHHPGLVLGSDVCRGSTWSGKQTIYFSNELTKVNALRVIIHELTHATLSATQMSIPEEFTEEQLADFFALYGEQIVEAAKKLERWAFSHEQDSCV